MRIQLLTAEREEGAKACSPTLKDLRDKNQNQVQKCLAVYESKPWCLKTGINWWLEKILPSASTPHRAESKFKLPLQVPVRAEKLSYKLNDAAKMGEILAMERDHIANLNRSINIITGIVKDSIGFIAMKLRENQFCLFGDLKSIYGLHKIVILPQISGTVSKANCIEFISFLIQLIDDGHFYCYVQHKMQERSMRKTLLEHVFMAEGDYLEPVKAFRMLDVYQNWITNICNELMKHPTENADDVAVCMEAEKKLMDLMDLITDAQSVSRIAQVQEIPFEIQVKVFSIVKKHEEIQKPMLILIPKKSQKFSYRYPVSFNFISNLSNNFLTNLNFSSTCCSWESSSRRLSSR